MKDKDWKKKLTPEQYSVLREKGTEVPFTGKLLDNKEDGTYRCAACGQVIFNSDAKFDSGSGWPSFSDAVKGSVNLSDDNSHGMHRTEVTCSNCGSHLGHFFPDAIHGNNKPEDYYCINSVALDFQPEDGNNKTVK